LREEVKRIGNASDHALKKAHKKKEERPPQLSLKAEGN